MNNELLSYFDNIVMIKVTGKNVSRFLTVIYKSKIKVLEVKMINRNEVNIRLSAKELDLLNKVKTSHKIETITYYGKLKIKNLFRQNLLIISSLIIGYIFLLLLANIIFAVEVIHDNKEIRTLVRNELEQYNIKKLRFKQSYQKIERIEKKILIEYKDKIEWLEIVEIGTKYIVRVEERKIPKREEKNIYQDIIATKNAVIMKIEAESGTIIKKINDYVKKGDIIISGKIKSGEKLMNIVKADGKILGEVWYNVRVELPMIRHEEKETGKMKTLYNLKVMNIKLPLIDFKPYKNKRIEEKAIISHHLLPLKITKEKQYEVMIVDYIYNDSEAIIKASNIAVEKMKEKLSDEEEIISQRVLKYYYKDKKIYLDVFFKVCEDITGTKEISLIESE